MKLPVRIDQNYTSIECAPRIGDNHLALLLNYSIYCDIKHCLARLYMIAQIIRNMYIYTELYCENDFLYRVHDCTQSSRGPIVYSITVVKALLLMQNISAAVDARDCKAICTLFA